jgi:hypothetical protein
MVARVCCYNFILFFETGIYISRKTAWDQLRNLSKFQVDSQVYESDLACLQGSAVNTNTSVVVEFRILDNSLIS